MLDRIDIHIEVPRVNYEKLSGDRLGETSDSIRARAQATRSTQLTRFSKLESSTSSPKGNIVANADMPRGDQAILQIAG
jgi:predicted ATPase with chaperone activity